MTTQKSHRASHPPAQLLPIPAAAERLGCSEMHIYRLVSLGELSAVDISLKGAGKSKTRIRSDELDAYIESRTRRATPAGPGAPAALPFAPSLSISRFPSRRPPCLVRAATADRRAKIGRAHV